MYAVLCDLFAKDCNIFLKSHPGDTSNYNILFENETIIDREIPSELIRFMVNRKFDLAICTYTTSIEALRAYIADIYDIDDTIVNYKENIFKLYFLYEIAQKFDCQINTNESSLVKCFNKFYNLNGNRTITYNSNIENEADIIVKNKSFDGTNMIIELSKSIANSLNNYDVETLYLRVQDKELQEKINDYKLDVIMPISKIHIVSKIKC